MYVLSNYSFIIHKFNTIIFKSYIDIRNLLNNNYQLLFSKPSCFIFTFNSIFQCNLKSCSIVNEELYLEFNFKESEYNFTSTSINIIESKIDENISNILSDGSIDISDTDSNFETDVEYTIIKNS